MGEWDLGIDAAKSAVYLYLLAFLKSEKTQKLRHLFKESTPAHDSGQPSLATCPCRGLGNRQLKARSFFSLLSLGVLERLSFLTVCRRAEWNLVTHSRNPRGFGDGNHLLRFPCYKRINSKSWSKKQLWQFAQHEDTTPYTQFTTQAHLSLRATEKDNNAMDTWRCTRWLPCTFRSWIVKSLRTLLWSTRPIKATCSLPKNCGGTFTLIVLFFLPSIVLLIGSIWLLVWGYSGKDLWKLKQERPELFGVAPAAPPACLLSLAVFEGQKKGKSSHWASYERLDRLASLSPSALVWFVLGQAQNGKPAPPGFEQLREMPGWTMCSRSVN